MNLFYRCWLCLVLLAWTSVARGESLLDPGFRLDPQLAGRVDVVKALPDGKILVGGSFTNLGISRSLTLVRLLESGSLDPSFSAPAVGNSLLTDGGSVNSIELGPDGAIWVSSVSYFVPWGNPYETKVTTHGYVQRFSPAGGSLDGYPIGADVRINFLPDGRTALWGNKGSVYSIGSFSEPFLTIGGQRIEVRGNPYWGSGSVRAFLATSDGGYLVSGDMFISPLPGETALPIQIQKWDASGQLQWTSDRVFPGLFAEEANGDIISTGGSELVRLSSEGKVLEKRPTPSQGTSQFLSDGRILISGWFDGFGGLPRKGLLALLPDGSVDLNFDPGLGFTAPTWNGRATLHSWSEMPDGRILVAGNFDSFDGRPCSGLIRLFPTNPPPHMAGTPTVFYAVPTPYPYPYAYECGPQAALRVVRAGATNLTHAIRLTTTAETAIAGVDFIPVDEDLVFLPGEREKLVHFRYVTDQVAEEYETFQVQLGEPKPPVPLVGTNRWQFHIYDSDCLVRFPTNVITVVEGADPLSVTLSVSVALDHGVEIQSRDVTARAGSDYRAITKTGWRGQGNAFVQIVVPDNTTAEGDRTFLLEFAPANDGRIVGYPSNVVVTIQDNDSLAGSGRFIRGDARRIHATTNGNWLLSGDLRSVDGVAATGLARFGSSGRADLAYSPPFRPAVVAAQSLPSGKLLVSFATGSEPGPASALVRLNADGTVDPSFAFPYLRSNGSSVEHIALLNTDGETVVAGWVGELGRLAVLRVSTTGTILTTWNLEGQVPANGGLMRFADTAALVRTSDSLLYLRSSGGITVLRSNLWSAGPALRATQTWLVKQSGKLDLEVLNTSGLTVNTIPGFTIQGTNYTQGYIDSWTYQNSRLLIAASLIPNLPETEPTSVLLSVDAATGGVLAAQALPTRLTSLAVSASGRIAAICHPPASAPDTRWLRFNADLSPANDLRLVRAVVSPLDQSVHLAMEGQAPAGYTLEASADLLSWKAISATAEINSGLTFIELPGAEPAAARFYRVLH